MTSPNNYISSRFLTLNDNIRRSSVHHRKSMVKQLYEYATLVRDEDLVYEYMEDNRIDIDNPHFWIARARLAERQGDFPGVAKLLQKGRSRPCMKGQSLQVLDSYEKQILIHLEHEIKRFKNRASGKLALYAHEKTRAMSRPTHLQINNSEVYVDAQFRKPSLEVFIDLYNRIAPQEERILIKKHFQELQEHKPYSWLSEKKQILDELWHQHNLQMRESQRPQQMDQENAGSKNRITIGRDGKPLIVPKHAEAVNMGAARDAAPLFNGADGYGFWQQQAKRAANNYTGLDNMQEATFTPVKTRGRDLSHLDSAQILKKICFKKHSGSPRFGTKKQSLPPIGRSSLGHKQDQQDDVYSQKPQEETTMMRQSIEVCRGYGSDLGQPNPQFQDYQFSFRKRRADPAENEFLSQQFQRMCEDEGDQGRIESYQVNTSVAINEETFHNFICEVQRETETGFAGRSNSNNFSESMSMTDQSESLSMIDHLSEMRDFRGSVYSMHNSNSEGLSVSGDNSSMLKNRLQQIYEGFGEESENSNGCKSGTNPNELEVLLDMSFSDPNPRFVKGVGVGAEEEDMSQKNKRFCKYSNE